MPYCPNCGSYVSPGTNVCSCGTTFGYREEVKTERKPTERERKQEEERKARNELYKKAEMLMDEGRYLEAIRYIDMALETSNNRFYIKAKAEAYYMAGMYEEALSLFKESLKHYWGIDSYVIYEWLGDTFTELNRFNEAIGSYERAIKIINDDYERVINFHREERWDCPSDAYFRSLLDEKNGRVSELSERIDYTERLRDEHVLEKSAKPFENDFAKNEEFLRRIGRQNLITITGTFFHGNHEFEEGMIFKLVREPDNEYDCDAIAVYQNDVKVGYVANTGRTVCHLTSKASDVQIPDVAFCEYIMHYGYMHHVARLIR